MSHDHEPQQPGAATCHAPFTSLYLDQRGFARVCPLNNGVPLGNVAHATLREIWHGPVARDLRERFAAGRWGVGCEVCEWQAGSAGEEQVYARLYDEWPMPAGEPEWPVHLELALSNRCNLRCTMCSGDQSSAIRSRREGFEPLPPAYPDRFFDEIAELLPHLRRAKFLGGEPFLVREHHRVWDLMVALGLETPIHVTTNGTVWNDRVEGVLESLPTSLAVSFDGLRPETIRAVRVGADPATLFTNLDRFQGYVERHGTYLSLTYCLMIPNWQEFGDFLAFATTRDLDVFVNLVTTPGSLSLYRLPAPELASVLQDLRAQEARLRPRLGRNEAVWEEQLRRLEARLDDTTSRATPRWLRLAVERAAEPDVVAGDGLDEEGPDRDDEQVLRAWAPDGPLTVVRLDEHDDVVAVEPDGAGLLHLPSDVRTSSFDRIAVLLSSFYGRRTTGEVLCQQPGLEDRIARYETVDVRTEVRSRTRPVVLDDGSRGVQLVLAARQEQLVATPVRVGGR